MSQKDKYTTICDHLDDVAKWLISAKDRDAIINAIVVFSEEMGGTTKITETEFRLLQRIAEAEKYFEYQGLEFQFGIEREFGLTSTGISEVREALVHDYRILSTAFSKMYSFLFYPDGVNGELCSYIGQEPTLIIEANCGEAKTCTLSPLKSILAVRLIEAAIANAQNVRAAA